MPAIENPAMHTTMHIMTTVIEIVIPRFTIDVLNSEYTSKSARMVHRESNLPCVTKALSPERRNLLLQSCVLQRARIEVCPCRIRLGHFEEIVFLKLRGYAMTESFNTTELINLLRGLEQRGIACEIMHRRVTDDCDGVVVRFGNVSKIWDIGFYDNDHVSVLSQCTR